MKYLFVFSMLAFSLFGATDAAGKLKRELDIRKGLLQPISQESAKFLCEQPAEKTKPIIMSVFKKQLDTDVGHTLLITLKDAEGIADSYIYAAKHPACPVGSKPVSPCDMMCTAGNDYKIIQRKN